MAEVGREFVDQTGKIDVALRAGVFFFLEDLAHLGKRGSVFGAGGVVFVHIVDGGEDDEPEKRDAQNAEPEGKAPDEGPNFVF